MSDSTTSLTLRLARGGTIFFMLLLVLGLTSAPGAQAQGTPPHRAGLVIRIGDGTVQTRCVSFSEPSISGADLLTRSGLPIVLDVSSSIGAGVCKIGPLGCNRGQSCFCQCEGSTCAYWQYFHMQNGSWKYSNVGAAVYQVTDGAVDGWAWGNNVAPAVMSLDQVCSGAALSPTQAATNPPVATSSAVTPAGRPLLSTPLPSPAPASSAANTTSPAPVAALATATTTAPFTAIPATGTVPLAPSPAIGVQEATTVSSAQTPLSSPPGTAPIASYAVFAVIVVRLGAWLAVQARRGGR